MKRGRRPRAGSQTDNQIVDKTPAGARRKRKARWLPAALADRINTRRCLLDAHLQWVAPDWDRYTREREERMTRHARGRS